jgi:arginine deiminase
VHVLGHRAVMVGMGERSTPMADQLLAAALFRSGQAGRRNIAVIFEKTSTQVLA